MAASAHRSRVRCVRPAHAAGTPAPAGSESQAIQADERQERDQIVAALTECKWRAPHAQLLGMSRATLYRRMARYRILPPHRR
jgi:transcriptional regulator of acetoin/glycerol metabolism